MDVLKKMEQVECFIKNAEYNFKLTGCAYSDWDNIAKEEYQNSVKENLMAASKLMSDLIKEMRKAQRTEKEKLLERIDNMCDHPEYEEDTVTIKMSLKYILDRID